MPDNTTVDNAANKGSELELIATPKFISLPQSIIVNEGETLRLPCTVERLEGFVLLWKKNLDIITVASQIIDKVLTIYRLVNFNMVVFREFAYLRKPMGTI